MLSEGFRIGFTYPGRKALPADRIRRALLGLPVPLDTGRIQQELGELEKSVLEKLRIVNLIPIHETSCSPMSVRPFDGLKE